MALREGVVVVDHPGHRAREHDAAGRTGVVWQPGGEDRDRAAMDPDSEMASGFRPKGADRHLDP